MKDRICFLTARQAEALELHGAEPYCGAHKHIEPAKAIRLVACGLARMVVDGKSITVDRGDWTTTGKTKRARDGTFHGPPGAPGRQMI
jgi:hypothetical protein